MVRGAEKILPDSGLWPSLMDLVAERGRRRKEGRGGGGKNMIVSTNQKETEGEEKKREGDH